MEVPGCDVFVNELMDRLSHNAEMYRSLKLLGTVRLESVLGVDDAVMGKFATHRLVRRMLAQALDASEGLWRMLHEEKPDGSVAAVVIPTAPYMLVRGILEIAGVALWLMLPTGGQELRERTLQVWRDNLRHAEQYIAEARNSFFPDAPSNACDVVSLKSVMVTCGFDHRLFYGPKAESPSGKVYPQVQSWSALAGLEEFRRQLEEWDVLHRGQITSWANAWQMCSGFAHGKTWAHEIFDSIEHRSGPKLGTTIKTTSINFPALTAAVLDAGLLLDAAMARYAQLTRTQDAEWEGIRQFPASAPGG